MYPCVPVSFRVPPFPVPDACILRQQIEVVALVIIEPEALAGNIIVNIRGDIEIVRPAYPFHQDIVTANSFEFGEVTIIHCLP